MSHNLTVASSLADANHLPLGASARIEPEWPVKRIRSLAMPTSQRITELSGDVPPDASASPVAVNARAPDECGCALNSATKFQPAPALSATAQQFAEKSPGLKV